MFLLVIRRSWGLVSEDEVNLYASLEWPMGLIRCTCLFVAPHLSGPNMMMYRRGVRELVGVRALFSWEKLHVRALHTQVHLEEGVSQPSVGSFLGLPWTYSEAHLILNNQVLSLGSIFCRTWLRWHDGLRGS